jgi:hypothetical protein
MSHVYPHTAGRSTKPLSGLEPLPSEPVYYRTGASAFSNQVFRRAIKEGLGLELVILSLSLSSTALGTALSAYDHDIPVTLIEDTLSPDAANASGLEAIETVARALVTPFVQVRRVQDMTSGAACGWFRREYSEPLRSCAAPHRVESSWFGVPHPERARQHEHDA